jgi:hypothetical protein
MDITLPGQYIYNLHQATNVMYIEGGSSHGMGWDGTAYAVYKYVGHRHHIDILDSTSVGHTYWCTYLELRKFVHFLPQHTDSEVDVCTQTDGWLVQC